MTKVAGCFSWSKLGRSPKDNNATEADTNLAAEVTNAPTSPSTITFISSIRRANSDHNQNTLLLETNERAVINADAALKATALHCTSVSLPRRHHRRTTSSTDSLSLSTVLGWRERARSCYDVEPRDPVRSRQQPARNSSSSSVRDRDASLLNLVPPTPGCPRRARSATLPVGLIDIGKEFCARGAGGREDEGEGGFAGGCREGKSEERGEEKWFQCHQRSNASFCSSPVHARNTTCECMNCRREVVTSCRRDVVTWDAYKQPNGFTFEGEQRYYNARQDLSEIESPRGGKSWSRSSTLPSCLSSFGGGMVQQQQLQPGLYDTPIQLGAGSVICNASALSAAEAVNDKTLLTIKRDKTGLNWIQTGNQANRISDKRPGDDTSLLAPKVFPRAGSIAHVSQSINEGVSRRETTGSQHGVRTMSDEPGLVAKQIYDVVKQNRSVTVASDSDAGRCTDNKTDLPSCRGEFNARNDRGRTSLQEELSVYLPLPDGQRQMLNPSNDVDIYKTARSYRVSTREYENLRCEMISVNVGTDTSGWPIGEISRRRRRSFTNRNYFTSVQGLEGDDNDEEEMNGEERKCKGMTFFEERARTLQMRRRKTLPLNNNNEIFNTGVDGRRLSAGRRPPLTLDSMLFAHPPSSLQIRSSTEIRGNGFGGFFRNIPVSDDTYLLPENNVNEGAFDSLQIKGSRETIPMTDSELLAMTPPPQCHRMTLTPYVHNSVSMLTPSPTAGYRRPVLMRTQSDSSEPVESDSVSRLDRSLLTKVPPKCYTLPRSSATSKSDDKTPDKHSSKTSKRNDQVNENDECKYFDNRDRILERFMHDKDGGKKLRNADLMKARELRATAQLSHVHTANWHSATPTTVAPVTIRDMRESCSNGSCLIDNYKNRKQQRKQQKQQLQPQQQQTNQLYVSLHFAGRNQLKGTSRMPVTAASLGSLRENV